MNKMISASLVSLSLLMSSASFAAQPASADKAAAAFNVDKASFVKAVTSSNAFEIESSKLAEQKAKDADVKKFASEMIKDHTMAGEELKKAAKLGDEAPVMSPKHAAMLEMLKGASDQDFEPLYIDMQAGAHMEAVSLFRTFSKSGDDVEVVAFAKAALPVLERHETHIMEIVATH